MDGVKRENKRKRKKRKKEDVWSGIVVVHRKTVNPNFYSGFFIRDVLVTVTVVDPQIIFTFWNSG